ncbi:MAG: aminotransferase class I/II-fold pyridoxal phosphate-dependent enzyme [Thermoguttaceae bacterium]
MASTAESQLQRLLKERTDNRVLRIFGEHVERQKNSYCRIDAVNGKEVVIGGRRLANFNTINYLGLEFHPRMIEASQEAVARWGTLPGSARAAAEICLYEEVEDRIATFMGVDNAILFTTVTMVNHGIIPLLMRQGSLILMDWEAHSSVQRAALEAKGGGATLLNFKHDDFGELARLLEENRAKYRHVMIALDGIYSMLGTFLDLPRYEELAARYDAFLYIDDAHGFGLVGPEGRGIVSHYGGSYENIVYVGSMEKALVSLGGFVIVPREARNFVRYTCHTFIFCGQMPPSSLATSLAAFDILETEGAQLRSRVESSVNRVRSELRQMGYAVIGQQEPFPLILVEAGSVYNVPEISQFFYDEGIHILTVGFPVIPLSRGALVRISLSAAHTDAQIDQLMDAFRKLRDVANLGINTRAPEPCPS